MSSIPEDIYLDILLRIPVKSLLACKCVCKTWFSIISDSNFVKSHLNLTVKKTHPSLMISIAISPYIAKIKEDRAVIYNVGYDSLFEKIEFDEAAAVQMYPLKSFEKLLGSCNGLVLFSFYKEELSSIHGVVHRDNWLRLRLWNPATGEHKELPESQNKILFQRRVTYTLCYDYRNDDYKLFKVVSYNKDTDETLVYVYTLRSNSWRSIQTIPNWFPSDTTSGVLVRNALHWIGSVDTRHSSEAIVSLNIRDEIFESMLIPEQLSKKQFYTTKIMTVGVLEGCLSVVDLKILSNEADVWVMQEYGVQESWVKQYSITSGLCSNVAYLRLISSKNGKILLQTRNGFILYNVKNSSTRETKLR